MDSAELLLRKDEALPLPDQISGILRERIVSGEYAPGKEHEGCAPSYSAAGESHLHLGKQVCRIYKNSMVQVRCICRDPTA